jgi:hypothetical protein
MFNWIALPVELKKYIVHRFCGSRYSCYSLKTVREWISEHWNAKKNELRLCKELEISVFPSIDIDTVELTQDSLYFDSCVICNFRLTEAHDVNGFVKRIELFSMYTESFRKIQSIGGLRWKRIWRDHSATVCVNCSLQCVLCKRNMLKEDAHRHKLCVLCDNSICPPRGFEHLLDRKSVNDGRPCSYVFCYTFPCMCRPKK